MNQLLAGCKRAIIDPGYGRQLAQQANDVTDWAELLAQAEFHRPGPYLYVDLKAAGFSLPLPVKCVLRLLSRGKACAYFKLSGQLSHFISVLGLHSQSDWLLLDKGWMVAMATRKK